MSENGPKLLAYVDNGMVQRNVELQWYISDFTNCNGTSQSWKNCNGTNPNIPLKFLDTALLSILPSIVPMFK
jgi:hypothetical protein